MWLNWAPATSLVPRKPEQKPSCMDQAKLRDGLTFDQISLLASSAFLSQELLDLKQILTPSETIKWLLSKLVCPLCSLNTMLKIFKIEFNIIVFPFFISLFSLYTMGCLKSGIKLLSALCLNAQDSAWHRYIRNLLKKKCLVE